MAQRQAIKGMLNNLSKEQFTEFCDELVNRKEQPWVALNKVEGKSVLDIMKVLLSTFNEKAVEVAAEVLNEIGCNEARAKLLAAVVEPGSSNMEATGGPSSENGSRDSEHFVDKHRIELINRVHCVADILDKLLQEKVITPSIYDEIMAIQTTQKQMRELFSGPLKAVGLRGKEVFYRILAKEEEYLIEELKGKK
ncbi:apoptosis-associated speck-like protein containing a CARD isoform X2 [Trematomus bernacchii]|uniref:apoptosis-associated speck-like protein containing a CARD isoform X2 n=1 Tax=Trematomus bernacchii TaxID=40690 RepID=UPI00146A54A3|nr:apoptosis-associated speck-like protein containing a CARD isoform X2 [Trematomus bernacchii]